LLFTDLAPIHCLAFLNAVYRQARGAQIRLDDLLIAAYTVDRKLYTLGFGLGGADYLPQIRIDHEILRKCSNKFPLDDQPMYPSRPEGQIGVLASHIHDHLVPLALQNQLP
jgi:hypothetical protein